MAMLLLPRAIVVVLLYHGVRPISLVDRHTLMPRGHLNDLGQIMSEHNHSGNLLTIVLWIRNGE